MNKKTFRWLLGAFFFAGVGVQTLHAKKALIIVDVQNDFITGSLAVPNGKNIPKKVNALAKKPEYEVVVWSQDWHPEDHISFEGNAKKRFPKEDIKQFHPFTYDFTDPTTTKVHKISQVAWPKHAVQHKDGAKFPDNLDVPKSLMAEVKDKEKNEKNPDGRTYNPNHKAVYHVQKDGKTFVLVRKGLNPELDSYSAFYDNLGLQSTGLGEYLQKAGVTEVDVAGIATDYCVRYTAKDAAKSFGFKTTLLVDASAATEGEKTTPEENTAAAIEALKIIGVQIKQPFSTGFKVAMGLGALALAGGGYYYYQSKKKKDDAGSDSKKPSQKKTISHKASVSAPAPAPVVEVKKVEQAPTQKTAESAKVEETPAKKTDKTDQEAAKEVVPATTEVK